ncbi:zinc knuckle [Colletotrichum higginsianum]|nr:zinc knuckle [Colletotrichum higginsianum]
MTDHAPGSGPATKEPSCINCGGTGHWAVACPEPVRAKPAHFYSLLCMSTTDKVKVACLEEALQPAMITPEVETTSTAEDDQVPL